MVTRPPFPSFLDSTSRAALASCPHLFYLSFVEHFKPKGESVHLHFGGCYARGLEVFRRAFYGEGASFQEAFQLGGVALTKEWGDFEAPEAGSGYLKTLPACLDAFGSYWEAYPPADDMIKPLETDKGPAVEFSFAIPIPDTVHPETGEPILYCGRFDMLGVFKGDKLFIEDDKTTSQLGQSWKNNFRLSSQMTGYTWACRQYGYNVMGCAIRGVAILKTIMKHQQVIEMRDNWMVDRWLVQLQRDIKRAISMWEEGYWDYAIDASCSNYGGCGFLEVCGSKVPEKYLELDFERRPWNPLKEEG